MTDQELKSLNREENIFMLKAFFYTCGLQLTVVIVYAILKLI